MIIYVLYSVEDKLIGVASSEEKLWELVYDLERFAPGVIPKEYHSYVDGYYTEVHRVYGLD